MHQLILDKNEFPNNKKFRVLSLAKLALHPLHSHVFLATVEGE